MATNFYKDLPLDFTPHPVSGDVRPVVDDVAIKRSIQNLIKTPKGSRPFHPEYGTAIGNFLFANADAFTKHNIRQSLQESLSQYETRINVIDIDPQFEGNDLKIKITFKIKNTNSVSSITTTIKRTA